MTQVSTQAVIQRINRKLRPDLEMLRATRGERMRLDVGAYHVINFRMNAIMHINVNPEAMARELGVLADHEEMADE